jgi:hypothetical protein
MCSSTKIETEKKQEMVSANLYFPTVIYQIEKPEFLNVVKNISNNALAEVKKTQKLNKIHPVHMTGNLFDVNEILPFQFYVGETARNILVDQGYNLDGFATYFSEMWCQEHHLTSSMEQHVHGNGSQIVGFYFLEVPKNSSHVIFHDPRAGKPLISLAETDMTQATFASNAINFEAKEGLLMFTNAWLPHSFSRHGNKKPMKFIHFNLGIRPEMINVAVPPAAEVV